MYAGFTPQSELASVKRCFTPLKTPGKTDKKSSKNSKKR